MLGSTVVPSIAGWTAAMSVWSSVTCSVSETVAFETLVSLTCWVPSSVPGSPASVIVQTATKNGADSFEACATVTAEPLLVWSSNVTDADASVAVPSGAGVGFQSVSGCPRCGSGPRRAPRMHRRGRTVKRSAQLRIASVSFYRIPPFRTASRPRCRSRSPPRRGRCPRSPPRPG